jgi:hypothetical protein
MMTESVKHRQIRGKARNKLYQIAMKKNKSHINKRQAKSVNRRLSDWCKGTLQKALEEISSRRSSSVTIDDAINQGWFNQEHLVGICKKGMGIE